MSWLRSIGNFFKSLFNPQTAAAIQRGLEAAAPYIGPALEVVKLIAAVTPTRADDEIVKLIERYVSPVVLTPEADRAEVLRKIAVAELEKRFPGVAERVLNRAIEIAYGALKP